MPNDELAGVGNSGRGSHALTVIVPTKNEAGNILPLLRGIKELDVDFIREVLFVDDSDDETPAVINRVNGEFPFPVRVLHRPDGRRHGGLGGAVVAGMQESETDRVVVMDGDLQHPPSVIPALSQIAESSGVDLVVASRYVENGSANGLSGRSRRIGSRVADRIARGAFREELAELTDPMSGFFLVDLERVDLNRLQPDGFKILMEIAVANPHLRVSEVPFQFEKRNSGHTKAGLREAIRFLKQVRSLSRARRKRRKDWLYQIHDLLAIESDTRLPELAKFEVSRLTRPADIEVGTRLRPGRSKGDHDFVYRELLGPLGFSITIDRNPQGYSIEGSLPLRMSPHVLYTNVVEPVARWLLVERGLAMVHAACIEEDGKADLVTARTDTGKTTTMLQLLSGSNLRFMSDDLVIVNEDGHAWSYPKPLTISAHTLRAVNASKLGFANRAGLPIQSRIHSRSGRRFAFVLARQSWLPVATINMLAQMVVPPPKYQIESLIEEVGMTETAELNRLFIIARGDRDERLLTEEQAATTLLANCEDAFGFPPYTALEKYLRYRDGRDLMEEYESVVRSAAVKNGALMLISDDYDWAGRIVAARESSMTIDLTGDEPLVVLEDARVESPNGETSRPMMVEARESPSQSAG